MSVRTSFETAVLAVLVGVVGCKSDSAGPGGNQGSISLSLSSSSLSVTQGGNGSVNATVARAGGFTGPVTISISGLPTAVTASATPASLASGATTSTIALTAGSGAAAGVSTVTVRASGSGVTDQTATLTLTVTAAQSGGFGMGLSPASVSVQQGGQATSTATLTRTGGFAGSVAFSASGAPAGVTVSFNPTSTTGNTTTLTVAATNAVAAGTYQVTIQASAPGVAAQTAALSVVVTAAGSANTAYTFCAGTVLFAAYQDGAGPWTKATVTGNTITFNLASGRGGLAVVTSFGGSVYSTYFFYGTRAELNIGTFACPSVVTKTVTGSVAGLAGTNQAYIGMGGAIASASALAPNFTLAGVRDGLTDLVAGRLATTVSPTSQVANAVIIRRGINPPANSTLPLLDFNSAEAVATVMRTFTLNNLGSDVLNSASMSYQTPNLSFATLYLETLLATNTRPFPTVPNGAAGELHVLTLAATPNPAAPVTSRDISAAFTASANQTLTLGPAIGSVTVTTAATTPGARLRAQYTLQPEYDKRVQFQYGSSVAGVTRGVVAFFMQGYLVGMTTIDYTIPDLSGLAGWNPIWNQVAGVANSWSFVAYNFNHNGELSANGDFVMHATRIGTITP